MRLKQQQVTDPYLFQWGTDAGVCSVCTRTCGLINGNVNHNCVVTLREGRSGKGERREGRVGGGKRMENKLAQYGIHLEAK